MLLNLSLPLYLKALGYSLVFIGLAYFAIVAFNVLVALALGMLGDRIGYSRTLIAAEALPLAATMALALSTNIYVIVASAMVGGITGSPGGMRGRLFPRHDRVHSQQLAR